MLWLTIWMTVLLKIPAVYLAYVIWWAVKDPPQAAAGNAGEGLGGGGIEPLSGAEHDCRRQATLSRSSSALRRLRQALSIHPDALP